MCVVQKTRSHTKIILKRAIFILVKTTNRDITPLQFPIINKMLDRFFIVSRAGIKNGGILNLFSFGLSCMISSKAMCPYKNKIIARDTAPLKL
jgi:hypothetical protein